jgi:hypothetical protein
MSMIAAVDGFSLTCNLAVKPVREKATPSASVG